jgi:hypothetical protein
MIKAGMKILFIAPKFFNYEQEIKIELELAGCDVDWFDDRPASTPLIKALIRFKPELIASYSDQYFDRIIEGARTTRYDSIFVIKGEALSKERLQKLKETQPQARFLYYSWDSLKNFKNSHAKLALFDKVYSFDSSDCINHPIVKHLALFYTRKYENITLSKNCERIDLLFLGSIHSDRYPVIQKIWASAQSVLPQIKLYDHFFYQSKWVFFIRKLFDPQFQNIPWQTVRWDSLNSAETIDLINRSQIIVDVHHPGQQGLTMRTIESLGAQKKLITTNEDIYKYDFYNPENIYVVDRNRPILTRDFLTYDYSPLDPEIYLKYSLRRWLAEIFA